MKKVVLVFNSKEIEVFEEEINETIKEKQKYLLKFNPK